MWKGQLVVRPWARGVNGQTDWQILKIFLPGFWIQSEISRGFQIMRIADSSSFWDQILEFACI